MIEGEGRVVLGGMKGVEGVVLGGMKGVKGVVSFEGPGGRDSEWGYVSVSFRQLYPQKDLTVRVENGLFGYR